MANAIVANEVDGRRLLRDRTQALRDKPGRVVVEAHDGTGVHPGRPEQAVAILPGASHRSLVGPDAPVGPEGF